MNNAIFREYDIRGIVGTDLQIEETYNLGTIRSGRHLPHHRAALTRPAHQAAAGKGGTRHAAPHSAAGSQARTGPATRWTLVLE